MNNFVKDPTKSTGREFSILWNSSFVPGTSSSSLFASTANWMCFALSGISMNFPRMSKTSRCWEHPSAISNGVSCLSSEVAVGSTLKRQESCKIWHFNWYSQTRILAKSEQSLSRSCESHPAAMFLFQAHCWCWPGWKIYMSFKIFWVLPNPLAGSEATLQTLSLLSHHSQGRTPSNKPIV